MWQTDGHIFKDPLKYVNRFLWFASWDPLVLSCLCRSLAEHSAGGVGSRGARGRRRGRCGGETSSRQRREPLLLRDAHRRSDVQPHAGGGAQTTRFDSQKERKLRWSLFSSSEMFHVRHFNFYITSLIKPGFILSTVREKIGAIATPDYIQNAPGLPKTRSGKVTKLTRNVNDWSDCGVAFSWTRWRFGHLTPDCAQNDVTPEWNPNVRLYLGLPPLAIPVNNNVLLLFIPWAAILESELSSWEQFEWNTPLFRGSSQCKGRLLSLALGVFSQVLHFMEHPDAEEGNGICGKCGWKDGNQLKHTASSLLQ